MKHMTLALLFACLAFVTGPIFAQDEAPPVDIYSTSMQAYLDRAVGNAATKVYSAAYCDALEKESDRLVGMLANDTRPSKDLPETIRKAHAAMKAYANAMGAACEELLWWDFEKKEMTWGTGYGYATMSFQAAIYWRHIIAYQEVLQTMPFDPHELDLTSPLTTTKIGGVAPMMLSELVKPPKQSKTTQKRVENHKILHGNID